MWEGSGCTEQRLFRDLAWRGVNELLAIVLQDRDDQSMRNQVRAKLPTGTDIDLSAAPLDWQDHPALRDALGLAASSKPGWYKQLHLGEVVGRVLASHLDSLATTNTAAVVETLRQWLYRD